MLCGPFAGLIAALRPGSMMGRTIWRFAGFTFSAEGGLEGESGPVALQPKAGGLLELLLRANGAAVKKERIAAALWRDAPPSDDSLARTVLALRRALGEDGGAIVRTIYGGGFKLACPVETVGGADGPFPSAAAALLRTVWEIASSRTFCSLPRAMEALRFTVARFPNYAPAWKIMADVTTAQTIYGELSTGVAAAQMADCCEKALRADPRCVEALAARGWALAMFAGRDDEGRRQIDEAIGRRPDWQSFFYSAWLRVDRRDLAGAMADIEAALELSPLDRTLLDLRAWIMLCQGRLDEADALARSADALRPDVGATISVRAVAACERGDFARGVAQAERGAASKEPSRIALSVLAYACAKAGDVPRARQTMAAISARPNGQTASFLAPALVALGELAEAERQLRRAEDEHCPWRAFAWCDPRLKPLTEAGLQRQRRV